MTIHMQSQQEKPRGPGIATSDLGRDCSDSRGDNGCRGSSWENIRGEVSTGGASTEILPATSKWSTAIRAGIILYILGTLIFVIAAYGQTATPIADPAANPDALVAFAQALHKAAKANDWRTVFALGLVGVIAIARWITQKWNADLEKKRWYRELVLPASPILIAVAMSVSTDLLAGKDISAAVWRGLNIGLMGGGAFKLIQIGTSWRKSSSNQDASK